MLSLLVGGAKAFAGALDCSFLFPPLPSSFHSSTLSPRQGTNRVAAASRKCTHEGFSPRPPSLLRTLFPFYFSYLECFLSLARLARALRPLDICALGRMDRSGPFSRGVIVSSVATSSLSPPHLNTSGMIQLLSTRLSRLKDL